MKKIILTIALGLFVTPITNAQDLPSHVPTDGLVAYYPFNGNANDESGNGNHGTVNGATLSSNRNGDDNSAYDFQVLDWDAGNNGGDYIYIPHSSEFNFESFTLSAWVYRKSAGASNSPQHLTIMRKFEEGYNNPNGESWHFDIAHGTDNGGSILIGRVIEQSPSPAINFECASTNTIIEREWTNVIMTYSDKTIKTFINGVESCSSTNNNITLNTLGTSGISIGMSIQANGNWGPFDGSIDDIGIWDRALTEEEIQNLYTSSTGDILLSGVVSAENNQIKNVADPTETQDAATKNYVDSNINSFSGSYSDLTDAPTMYTQAQVDALITNLQNQINDLKPLEDVDGNTYEFIKYGDQVWTVENAEMVTYRDGTEIPEVTDGTAWSNLTTGAWCYYDNDSTKGRLYNWYAIMGIHDAASLADATLRKAFAPEGWHVASDAEWTTLENYLIANGYNYDSTTTENKIGKAMASTAGWNSSANTGAPGNDQSLNNGSGFNAFPEGSRRSYDGAFPNESNYAFFWSSTESSADLGWYRYLSFGGSYLYRNDYDGKRSGLSVRFVRD